MSVIQLRSYVILGIAFSISGAQQSTSEEVSALLCLPTCRIILD